MLLPNFSRFVGRITTFFHVLQETSQQRFMANRAAFANTNNGLEKDSGFLGLQNMKIDILGNLMYHNRSPYNDKRRSSVEERLC